MNPTDSIILDCLVEADGDIEAALLAAEHIITLQLQRKPPSLSAYFAHDIANRHAQGILDHALQAARGIVIDAREDLASITLKEASGEAILSFIEKYRQQLATLLTTAQLASALEGAREVAVKIPHLEKDANELAKMVGEIEQPTLTYPALSISLATDDPLFATIDEAAKLLASKNVLSRQGYDTLSAQARAKAFTVAGVDAQDTLTKIRDVLAENVRKGVDHATFRKAVLEAVEQGTFLSEAHLETVFRTDVQGAFSDGQMSVLQNPLIRSGFPYSTYNSIHDDRARHEHNELDGRGIDGSNIYRNDDPVFHTFRPPWDYNCRCSWTPITVRQAAQAGIREAQLWQATGIPPADPAFVEAPPFQPPEGFERAALVAPLSIQLSLQPMAAFDIGDGSVGVVSAPELLMAGGMPHDAYGKGDKAQKRVPPRPLMSEHPRDRSNRFIPKLAIVEAANDPEALASLRESLPEEEQWKLDRAIEHLHAGGTIHHPSENPNLGIDIKGKILDAQWATYATSMSAREEWVKRDSERTTHRKAIESLTRTARDARPATRLHSALARLHGKISELSVSDIREQIRDALDTYGTHLDAIDTSLKGLSGPGSEARAVTSARHAGEVQLARQVEVYIAQVKKKAGGDKAFNALIEVAHTIASELEGVLEGIIEKSHVRIDAEHAIDMEVGEPVEPDEQDGSQLAPTLFSIDAHGREHRGRGPGGGQFIGKGYTSAATVRYSNPDETHVRLGKLLDTSDKETVASIVGAPDDAKIKVAPGQTSRSWDGFRTKSVNISVDHPGYFAERYLYREPASQGGRLVIKNETFHISPEYQAGGWGVEIFTNQVEAAHEAGVDIIKCWAGRYNYDDPDNEHNGYYTWPRFGYDESLESIADYDPDTAQAAWEAFPHAESVLDVMDTPEGRDWWRTYGTEMRHAEFDLAAGSRSMEILEEYLAEREERKSLSLSNKTKPLSAHGSASTGSDEGTTTLAIDAGGREHRGKGQGGGQFVRKGAGGGDTSERAKRARQAGPEPGSGVGPGRSGDGGQPDATGPAVADQAARPSAAPDGKDRSGAGVIPGAQTARDRGPTTAGADATDAAGVADIETTADDNTQRLMKVNQRISKYANHFHAKGQSDIGDWMDSLLEHINNVGVDAALVALGDEKFGEQGRVQYKSTAAFDSSKDTKFLKRYLDHAGILLQTGSAPDPSLPVLAAAPVRGLTARAGQTDVVPTESTLATKLEESKHLPGLESTEDISVVAGHPVKQFTPDVIREMDKRYGKGKWIVKSYGDEAYAGYGIFFPQRIKQIQQNAKETLYATNEKLARFGYSLARKGGKTVGVKAGTGAVWEFGSPQFNSLNKTVRKLGRVAAIAAMDENGARLPTNSLEALEQNFGVKILHDTGGAPIGVTTDRGEDISFGTPEYQKFLQRYEVEWEDNRIGDAIERASLSLDEASGINVGFMVQPAFEAVGVTEAERALGMTWETSTEGRVHVVIKNGRASVVPYATLANRSDSMPVVFANDDIRAMEQAAQEAIDALPESERTGQVYAPDVMRTKDGWCVVEANASASEGSSLWLEENPLVIDSYVSHVSGREPAHVRFMRGILCGETGGFAPLGSPTARKKPAIPQESPKRDSPIPETAPQPVPTTSPPTKGKQPPGQ